MVSLFLFYFCFVSYCVVELQAFLFFLFWPFVWPTAANFRNKVKLLREERQVELDTQYAERTDRL